MNSPFSNMFLSYIAQIQEITVTYTDGTTKPLYIDMNYGQLLMPERPAVDFPCVLIDFHDWTFENLSELVQTGAGIVCFTLATDPYEETSSITPDVYRKAAINILELEWQIYKKLQGFKPTIAVDNTNTPIQLGKPMLRTNVSSDNRRPGIKGRPMYFKNGFTDYSAKPVTNLAPADPNITATFQL